MEEIKVGEYVRTHKGKIYKVTNVYVLKITCGHTSLRYTDISKHSFNIIDLIEVGDFVNGKYVFDNFEKEGKRYLKVDCMFGYYSEEEIGEIVTKEQFNSIKYIVKE